MAAIVAKGKTKKAAPVDDDAPAPKKTKSKPAEVVPLTLAGRLAARLNKEHGDGFADCVIDPDAPIKDARGWINMPAWWQELTDTPGAPLGHPIVVQGMPDTGKTTLAMEVMIEAQRAGFIVILVNTERKFNKKRFVRMGGDLTKLVEILADTIEEAYDKLQLTLLEIYGGERTIRSAGGKRVVEEFKALQPDAQTCIVWDSIGQTPTEAEADTDAYDQQPATAARVIKRNVRKITKLIANNDVAMLYVNHVYHKIGVMTRGGTAGYGGSGAYYAAVFVIEVERVGSFKRTVKGRVLKYMRVKLKLKKNHLSDYSGAEVVVNLMPSGIQQKVAKDRGDEREHDGPAPKSAKRKVVVDDDMDEDLE